MARKQPDPDLDPDSSNDPGRGAEPSGSAVPYLDLAREINEVVQSFAIDDSADVDTFVEALDAIPVRERARIAMGVFGQLPPDRRWSILERTFGDVELRSLLVGERQRLLDELARADVVDAVGRQARDDQRIDFLSMPSGVHLVLGLFRSADVRAALVRGSESQVCAREIVVRTGGPSGEVRVIADVFNPRHGYFVTRDYDESVWETERLVSHSTVIFGSSTGSVSDPETEAGSTESLPATFEPVLYAGGRVDTRVGDVVRAGHLHLGFVVLGDNDLFVAPR